MGAGVGAVELPGLAISIAVTVVTVVPPMRIISAMVIAIPPTPSLGLAQEERASEQKRYERANNDLYGAILAIGTELPGLTERRRVGDTRRRVRLGLV